MRVEKPNLNQIETSQNAYKTQNGKKIDSQKKNEKNTIESEKKDSVEISPKAKELFEKAKSQKPNKSESSNEVNAKNLRHALQKTKLARDEKQAARIIDKVMTDMNAESKQKADKIELARQRVNSDFYNSPEVFKKIAEGLMKEMKLF